MCITQIDDSSCPHFLKFPSKRKRLHDAVCFVFSLPHSSFQTARRGLLVFSTLHSAWELQRGPQPCLWGAHSLLEERVKTNFQRVYKSSDKCHEHFFFFWESNLEGMTNSAWGNQKNLSFWTDVWPWLWKVIETCWLGRQKMDMWGRPYAGMWGESRVIKVRLG